MSGFDSAIKDLVTNETLVYGGFSAGSCVAAQTLKGIELVDDPEQMPEGYDKAHKDSPYTDRLTDFAQTSILIKTIM